MADDTTGAGATTGAAPIAVTATTTTVFTPVVSTNFVGAMVSFMNTRTAHEGVETEQIQEALDQHTKDQQNLLAANAQIKADQDDKTASNALLTTTEQSLEAAKQNLATAQQNAVSPAIISSIDAATNALASGQPLPAFPGAEAPAPIAPPAVIAGTDATATTGSSTTTTGAAAAGS